MTDTATLQKDKAWLDQALAILADEEAVRTFERIRRHLADATNPDVAKGFQQLLTVHGAIQRTMRSRGAKAVSGLIAAETDPPTLL